MTNFADKAVYQIYPKSFKDSNGDGLGDIRGIIEKLDYLKELGIDYIWCTPFFPSPQKDNGYDVANYCKIDPRFGTMEDVEELIREADKRNIGLMFDMVFNHTSTEHIWFQKALEGDPVYMDYYIFKEGNAQQLPTNWVSKFGGPAWKYVPHLKKWYLHLFDETQADLNWENPRVREELKNVVRFWKEKGVKGFRFDVVNLISKPEVFENDKEGDGRRFYTDGPHVHDFLKELVRDTGIENLITVGEMSSTTLDNCIRYASPKEKELSMCFHFHHLKIDYKNGEKWELMEPDLTAMKELFQKWQLGMQKNQGRDSVFWCNHDQPRIVSRLGDDKKYWKESAKMLAASIHFMRGTPYIFQGEEIGMTNPHYTRLQQYRDVESLNYYHIMRGEGKSEEEALTVLDARSRDNGRTPMQWENSPYAGFSNVEPWIQIPDNYVTINAKKEMEDADSIYHYYKRLIALRKEKKVISEGTISFLAEPQPCILAYTRDTKQEKLLVINNFSEKEVKLSEKVKDLRQYEKLLGNYPGILENQEVLTLRPYETIALYRSLPLC